MFFSNSFIYYYLRARQYYSFLWNISFIKFLGIKDARIIINEKSQNIFYRYLIYKFLDKMTNLLKYKKYIIMLKEKIEIKADKLQLTKITNSGEKTIIVDKEKVGFDSINLKDINNYLENIEIDDNMLNCIFVNFELINSENEKICLKEFLIKYKDTQEKHDNTLKNIIKFNDIKYNDNSLINIKFFKNKKMIFHQVLLKNVYNNHINYFLNIN